MNEINTSNEEPKALTTEEQKAADQKKLLDEYIAKVRAKIEYQKKVASNTYHIHRKNKAKAKKKSQKIGKMHDKKFLKRKSKRDFKMALKNAKIVVVHDNP